MLVLCMCLAFLPAKVFAAGPAFHTGDIAAINAMIDNNSLALPKAPANGSSVPGDWTGKVFWSAVAPRRVTELYLPGVGIDGTLDVSALTGLTILDCSSNDLTGILNVSNLKVLERLYCHENGLTGLNASGLTSLTALLCHDNKLTELKVDGLTALMDLRCSYNDLTGTLDVRDSTDLLELRCSDNGLTELKLDGLMALELLYCAENQLTELNVSGLTAMTHLNCSDNGLTELVLNENAPYSMSLDVRYNFMADTSAVTGKAIPWDDRDFRFNPQCKRITYDANGGSGEMEDGKAIDGVAFKLPENRFTPPAGKKFTAWAIGSANGLPVDPLDYYTFFADMTVYALWEPAGYGIEVFRTGNQTSYHVGETVALAARAEGGTIPYRYQFYVVRSNGSKVVLRDYAYNNTFNWKPVTPDTYRVGVSVKDAAGNMVSREKTVKVTSPAVEAPEIAVFRTGNKTSYTTGETIALAARAEGGTAPYRYRFYVVRSNGARVTLRNYALSNIFSWKPVTPDTYRVGVDVIDAKGKTVNQVKTVTVNAPSTGPLKVAIFRIGNKPSYTIGETIALAARGEGGTAPYQYQFYVYRSNGAKVILKNYSGVNYFGWKPQTPDTYRVCVAIKDSIGTVVTQEVSVTVT